MPGLPILGLRPFFGVVKLVAEGQAAFCIAACGTGVETGFGIELGDGHAGPFIDELVETYALAFGEAAEAVGFGIGESNDHGGTIPAGGGGGQYVAH